MNLQDPQVSFVQSFVETKKTFHISDSDFFSITREIYGTGIEILESPNDTTHEVDVNGQDIDSIDLADAIRYSGIECWKINCVLNDLCRRGLIDTGEYFIRVSW